MSSQQQQQTAANVPPHFICPLTKQIIKEPMLSKYGNRFERAAILKWLEEGNMYYPVTHKPLRPSNLITDTTMLFQIQAWSSKHTQSNNNNNNNNGQEIDQITKRLGSAHIMVTPERFICPLTKKMMKDPVMTKTGVNYERKAILRQLQENGSVCPVTKLALPLSRVIANYKLSYEIKLWERNCGPSSLTPIINSQAASMPQYARLLRRSKNTTKETTTTTASSSQKTKNSNNTQSRDVSWRHLSASKVLLDGIEPLEDVLDDVMAMLEL